jgi:hypothetical protein
MPVFHVTSLKPVAPPPKVRPEMLRAPKTPPTPSQNRALVFIGRGISGVPNFLI